MTSALHWVQWPVQCTFSNSTLSLPPINQCTFQSLSYNTAAVEDASQHVILYIFKHKDSLFSLICLDCVNWNGILWGGPSNRSNDACTLHTHLLYSQLFLGRASLVWSETRFPSTGTVHKGGDVWFYTITSFWWLVLVTLYHRMKCLDIETHRWSAQKYGLEFSNLAEHKCLYVCLS